MNRVYENETNEMQLILELLRAIRQRLWWIAVVTVLAGALGWAWASFLITPRYEASVNLIVNTRTDASGIITSDSIASAKNLVNTYAIIIKSNTVLNKTISQLGLDMSYTELAEIVQVEGLNNTQVMQLSVQHPDPVMARRIITSITSIAPGAIEDAVEAGSCKVISLVTVSERPVYPDVPRITLIAAFLALVVCLGAVILREVMYDYIVDENDVAHKLGLPVLGVVPEVEKEKN